MVDDRHHREAGLAMRIANEFAAVTVRKVVTRAGARLEVSSERTGRVIDIDAVGLEALCLLTPDDISKLVSVNVEGGPSPDDAPCIPADADAPGQGL